MGSVGQWVGQSFGGQGVDPINEPINQPTNRPPSPYLVGREDLHAVHRGVRVRVRGDVPAHDLVLAEARLLLGLVLRVAV